MISGLATEQVSIQLPKVVGSRDIDALFRVCEQVRTSFGPIVLDGQNVEFFDPLGIAVLGALLEPLAAQRQIRIEWLPVKIGTYLDRMDVIDRCSIEGIEARPIERRDLSDRLVELTRLTREDQVDEAAHRLASALAGHLTSEDPDAERDERTGLNKFEGFSRPLQYALTELLLNALSHAKRDGRFDASVWVAAQFYPTTGTIKLAIVDNGCGVLATLKDSPALTEKSHIAAIPAALTPYVSCNPDLGLPGGTSNQGVGLTTSYRIAKAARGGLVLVSGDAAVSAFAEVTPTKMGQGASWQGVAIQMQFRRALLPSVNIPELLPPVANAPAFNLRFDP